MPRLLPTLVENHLTKSRNAALQAVGTYNDPLASFRSGTFIVLMVIAWTSLLLAAFIRRGDKPYYRARKKDSNEESIRFERIDGERKPWDLGRCAKEYWDRNTNAVTKNLDFILGLRHRIEHRDMPELDLAIFGECQAMLHNYEDVLVDEFGDEYALNESLAMSLQFSRLRDTHREGAARELTRPLAENVRDYIDTFRSGLTAEVAGDMAFSYKVFLLPNVGNHRTSDALAVEWVTFDPDDDAQREALEKVVAIVKHKHVAALNTDVLSPTEVKDEVARRIAPKVFEMHHHVSAWRHFRVRPAGNSSSPEVTKTDYCLYDVLHGDYGYTQAWVDFLCDKLSDAAVYRAITGDSG